MSFTKITCPHCFATVFVGADGICPGCQDNARETTPEKANLIPVEFVDGEVLPAVCVLCAQPSTCYVKVGEKNETAKMDGIGIVSRLLAAIGGVAAFRIGPEPDVREYKILVRIPACERHWTSRLLTPLYVDYDWHRLTLPVHRDFIHHWRPSRGKA